MTTKLSQIKATSDDASSLQSQVNEYKEAFELFQRQLDARNIEISEGAKKQRSLLDFFDTQQSEIKRITQQSTQMLSSATVAGLAANFNAIRSELTGELRKATSAFYWGILLLTISALPLAALVLQPLLIDIFPEWFSSSRRVIGSTNANGWQYIGQVLGRLLILLPAAWYVSFAGIRYFQLFRLREHYAYKYSMAASVEGFKQQAPGYEADIAAVVFEQLAFNPADKLLHVKDASEANMPKPIMGQLIDKLLKKQNPE